MSHFGYEYLKGLLHKPPKPRIFLLLLQIPLDSSACWCFFRLETTVSRMWSCDHAKAAIMQHFSKSETNTVRPYNYRMFVKAMQGFNFNLTLSVRPNRAYSNKATSPGTFYKLSVLSILRPRVQTAICDLFKGFVFSMRVRLQRDQCLARCE